MLDLLGVCFCALRSAHSALAISRRMPLNTPALFDALSGDRAISRRMPLNTPDVFYSLHIPRSRKRYKYIIFISHCCFTRIYIKMHRSFHFLQAVKAAALLGILLCPSCACQNNHPDAIPIAADSSKNINQNHDSGMHDIAVPVDSILTIHAAAVNKIHDFFSSAQGIQPPFDDCLDSSSGWLAALAKHCANPDDDALRMLLALRMAQTAPGFIPKSIQILENIKQNDSSLAISDVINYYIGVMAFKMADLNMSEKTAGADRESALKQASAALVGVLSVRSSPYYHMARELKLRADILSNAADPDELAQFIADYPAYPGLDDFKISLAELQCQNGNAGQCDSAAQMVKDIVFYRPWSAAAPRANQWIADNHINIPERSFEETFEQVDKLRRARFWDDAERAAQAAMDRFPDSMQLAVQHARIAYERSDHQTAADRFENILRRLDGKTIDKLKPSGVIAYLYRVYAYMGNREKALEYFDKNAALLGKADRARAAMDFALSIGALDTAYENAKKIIDENAPTDDLVLCAFIAYLNRDWEIARRFYTLAIPALSGSYKRRARYFLAQATLKSAAAAKAELESKGDSKDDKSNVDNSHSENNKINKKTNKKSKNSKKTKVKINLPKASAALAKQIFQSLINDDSGDYYAIIAWARLQELEEAENPPACNSENDVSSADKCTDENSSSILSAETAVQSFNAPPWQDPQPFRPWYRQYTFDEKAELANFHDNVLKYRDLFPLLDRVEFFHKAELYRERNQAFREIAVEAVGIARMSKRPRPASLWTVKWSRDGHFVDNRRRDTGFWGKTLDVYRFDLPAKNDKKSREILSSRQSQIFDKSAEIVPFIKKTLVGFHDYYLSRRYTPAPAKTCGSPDNLKNCSTLYPHAYAQDVIDNAELYSISPDIVWAVMNIESAFNPDSISISEAYGLLQIIPMTGYKIADAMNEKQFGPYDLIRPEVSIKMGTWYFNRILRKFHGYITLSMAAYNGGPHQVARWLTAYADRVEHDAFIELIPYNEARNYVKKGMARLLIFQRIDSWNPNHFFYIPNTLPASYKDMPNY